MAIPKVRAIGHRGSWFADIDGEALPCVHEYWTRRIDGKLMYVDPYCVPEEAKWAPFLAALRDKKRAILTKDKPPSVNMIFEREGYIALFQIDTVTVDDGTLRFAFVERLADIL